MLVRLREASQVIARVIKTTSLMGDQQVFVDRSSVGGRSGDIERADHKQRGSNIVDGGRKKRQTYIDDLRIRSCACNKLPSPPPHTNFKSQPPVARPSIDQTLHVIQTALRTKLNSYLH